VVGALVLLGILMLCQRYPVGAIGRLMHFVEATVKPLFRECGVIDLLLVSLLAGVGEELFFRGLVQGGLEGWFGKWGALGMASVVFGLAHCMTREYVVFAAGLGLLLGWLAIATGTLLAPIIAHAGYDFMALLMLTKESRRKEREREWEQ
jgi:hypothetical protein